MNLDLTPDFWIKIGTAVLCGVALGLERQVRGKPAGIRTSVLVCLGSATFTHMGSLMSGSDPSRILGQIVVGVGFLGAGVIMNREGLVMGVTSAAVLWILAAVGGAAGLGYTDTALVVTLLAVTVVVGVEALEEHFKSMRKGVHALNKSRE